jgi:hypothetical protein
MNYFMGLGDFSENGNPHFSRKRGKIPGGKDFYRQKGTPCRFDAIFRPQEKPRHPFFTIPKHRIHAKP